MQQKYLAENHTEVQNNSISVVMQKYGAKYYIIYIYDTKYCIISCRII